MKRVLMVICAGLTFVTGTANSQWSNFNMPNWQNNNQQQNNNWGGNMMPWNGFSNQRQQPRQQNTMNRMMPWNLNSAPQQQQSFGNNMMPGFSSMPGFSGNSMPWNGFSQQRQQPRQQNTMNRMMPWNFNSAPQQQQGFGNNMMPGFSSMPGFSGGNMPWSSMSGSQNRQPQSNGYMMPGMEQGIRTMMAPGKIMADEATPTMMMKPTWQ